jgi:hypothetical protein
MSGEYQRVISCELPTMISDEPLIYILLKILFHALLQMISEAHNIYLENNQNIQYYV